ncbi:MAG: PQQ-binding-like beta-propeller repeat protein [Candidatus Latescibacteria bacterium]|nr:PQQ-binding-like beta-propeller repeat protein [Candidatus Latescibacterota bacterium]
MTGTLVRGGILLALFAALAVSLPATAAAEDWPFWRGPHKNWISTESEWSPEAVAEGNVLWRANVGKGHSSFAVADGRAYTLGNTDNEDTLYCFEADTGEVLWQRSYPCRAGNYPGPRATPTVDEGRVFTFSRDAVLRCFDAKSGRPRWQQEAPSRDPKWGHASSPIVHEDLVVVNAGTSGTAFKKKTGSRAWSGGKGTPGYASPVLLTRGRRESFLIFSAKALYCVDARTGRPLWDFPWITKYDVNAGDPVLVGDDHVFISSSYGTGCALLKLTGRDVGVVWQNKNMKNHMGSTIYFEGHLYGFDDATLTCLDAKTGERKWSRRGMGKGGLMMADGKLLITTERGIDLVVAEATPKAYQELARTRILDGHTWTSPVLANGRIYCRNDAGDVACLAAN